MYVKNITSLLLIVFVSLSVIGAGQAGAELLNASLEEYQGADPNQRQPSSFIWASSDETDIKRWQETDKAGGWVTDGNCSWKLEDPDGASSDWCDSYQQVSVPPGSNVTLTADLRSVAGPWKSSIRIALFDGANTTWDLSIPGFYAYCPCAANEAGIDTGWQAATTPTITASSDTVTVWIHWEGQWGRSYIDNMKLTVSLDGAVSAVTGWERYQ